MIDKLKITNMNDWPVEATEQLYGLLNERIPHGATVDITPESRLVVRIHDDWPKLKRENLKRGIVKSLQKVETDHGLTATVESIEEMDTSDLDGFN